MERSVLGIVLAGGEGKRLYPLTRDRAKPAVPFGGQYRIIDFVLSNFINSGIRKVFVLTQFMSASLHRHIYKGWANIGLPDGFVEVIPAYLKREGGWFKGTADAIYQNLNLVKDEKPRFVAIFGGDHIYRMDIQQMLSYHLEMKADITVAATVAPIEDANQFGCIEADENNWITNFMEKPENPPAIKADPSKAFVSMGNYIFSRDVLEDVLREDSLDINSPHDFGKLLQVLHTKYKVCVYNFLENIIPGVDDREKGYWRDVGTIRSYFQSNMDLISVSPVFNLYNEEWPIRTAFPMFPPAKFVFADEESSRIGKATDSIVCPGSIVSGGQINRCVLGSQVRINSYSSVDESILFENVSIGRYAKLRRVIVDKDVVIPHNMVIGYDEEEDRKRFFVTDDGIVVIPKGTRF